MIENSVEVSFIVVSVDESLMALGNQFQRVGALEQKASSLQDLC